MSSNIDPVSLTLGLGLGMVLMASIRRLSTAEKAGLCNPGIMKDQPKVATMAKVKDVEDLLKEKPAVAYCRWPRPRAPRAVSLLLRVLTRARTRRVPFRPRGRCWRSKTFPFCDGSHAKFNEASGDNTGPLVFK